MLSTSQPTSDELKALQRRLNLTDVHLCWVGDISFVIAHTDEERSSIDLKDCELHVWMRDLAGPPADPGYYVVTLHEADSYSEQFPLVRFDFTSLGLWGEKEDD